MHDDLKRQFKERDRVVRAISRNGLFRAAAVKTTAASRVAQERHQLDALGAVALGRALTASSLMASFLKGEERVIVEAEGNGPIAYVYAESLQIGEVRGYLRTHDAPDPEAASLLGTGRMKVSRILFDNNEPVTGIVELKRGDISTDLSHYLTQSEQIPSVVVIDVDMNDDGTVQHAAGLIVQAMPGATPEDIFATYDAMTDLPRLAALLEEGCHPDDMLARVLPGEIEIVASTPVDFFCRCSMDRFKAALMTLGYEEIASMEQAGHNELICQYCNEHYYLSGDDFQELKSTLLAQRN